MYTSPVMFQPPKRTYSAWRSGFRQYLHPVGPLIATSPAVPVGTSRPASSTTRQSYPGTGTPVAPGRTLPASDEMKMWNISVEPIPSSSSIPVRFTHSSYVAAGSGSAARPGGGGGGGGG